MSNTLAFHWRRYTFYILLEAHVIIILDAFIIIIIALFLVKIILNLIFYVALSNAGATHSYR